MLGFVFLCCIFFFPETKFNRVFAPSNSLVSSSPLKSGSIERVEESEKALETDATTSAADYAHPENVAPMQTDSKSGEKLSHVHTHQDPWLGRGKPSKGQWKLFQPYEGNFLLELWLPWELSVRTTGFLILQSQNE